MMTDRYNYLVVGLEKEIRSDDAVSLIEAIKMLKGVMNVKANVSNADDWIAKETARNDLIKKLWDVLR